MKFQLFNCRSQRRRFKQYNLFSFGAPLLGTVQYSTVQYSTVQYSTVQYSTVQHSTVQMLPPPGFPRNEPGPTTFSILPKERLFIYNLCFLQIQIQFRQNYFLQCNLCHKLKFSNSNIFATFVFLCFKNFCAKKFIYSRYECMIKI